MTLTLTILRCPEAVPSQTRTVASGEFTIGRGPDNDWVLPDLDRHVSKRHCVLAFRNGGWQVAGTSSNGTFLNPGPDPASAQSLEATGPRPVSNGDRLVIGPYEIELLLAAAVAARHDPFRDDPFAPAPRSAMPPNAPVPPTGEGFDDWLAGIAMPPPQGPTSGMVRPQPPASQPDHSPAIADVFRPGPARLLLPSDWDLESGSSVPAPPAALQPVPAEPAPLPVPVSASHTEATSDLLAAFLRGAGMSEGSIGDGDATDYMATLGAAFRAMVTGLRQSLVARAAIKDEFRISQTLVRARGNNPLKFSADDDDALAALLGVGRRSDMDPREAITDALSDIRSHELATITAMQSAVRALVARFDPAALRSDAGLRGNLHLASSSRRRAWEAFEVLHLQIAQGLSDDFDSVFGKSFARAYEKAISELAARNGDS